MLLNTDGASAPSEPTWSVVVPRALEAYLADPTGLHARVDHALLWKDLALAQPELQSGARPPLGYSQRADGEVQDALLTERAIDVITALIDDGITGPALYQARAELLIGWNKFGLAAVDLRAGIATCPDDPAGHEWRVQLEAQLAAVEAAWLPKMKRKERMELARLADRFGQHAAPLLVADPPQLRFFAYDDHSIEVDPRVRSIDAQARAIGLHHVAWTEDPVDTASKGYPVIGGVWTDDDGSMMLFSVAAGDVFVFSATTLLTDGSLLETVDSRGRYLPQGGPKLDRLLINVDGSCEALCRLHALRLRVQYLDRPGTAFVPMTDQRDFLKLALVEWALKREFRLEVGKSETEARAIPIGRPEFVGLVQAAARRAVAAKAAEQASGVAFGQPAGTASGARLGADPAAAAPRKRRRWFGD